MERIFELPDQLRNRFGPQHCDVLAGRHRFVVAWVPLIKGGVPCLNVFEVSVDGLGASEGESVWSTMSAVKKLDPRFPPLIAALEDDKYFSNLDLRHWICDVFGFDFNFRG